MELFEGPHISTCHTNNHLISFNIRDPLGDHITTKITEEQSDFNYKSINYLVGKIMQYTKADPEITLKIVKNLESETS